MQALLKGNFIMKIIATLIAGLFAVSAFAADAPKAPAAPAAATAAAPAPAASAPAKKDEKQKVVIAKPAATKSEAAPAKVETKAAEPAKK
jgi:hypothetical protein